MASGQYRDIEECYDNDTLCFSTNTNRDVSLKTWQSADEFCRSRSATLPVISSAYLQYRLGAFLIASDLTIDNVWLGAKAQTYSDSVYHWLDGTPLARGMARPMFPIAFFKICMRTKFPVCNTLQHSSILRMTSMNYMQKTCFKGRLTCVPNFLACAHLTGRVPARSLEGTLRFAIMIQFRLMSDKVK